MSWWIAVLVVVLAIALVAVVVAVVVPARRRSSAAPVAPEPAPRTPPVVAPAPPMTGLESALAQVTDRDGRPIKDRIDAEAVHVDPLRDPDDTGPLLRRALDSVSHHDAEPVDPDADRRSDA